jgi:HEAT repeat protein
VTTARRLLMPCLFLCAAGCGKTTADWAAQLQSSDPRARLHAVHALDERSGDRETVLPALLAALRDEDVYVRRDAARALGRLAPPAREEAVPALQPLLRDREPSVRKAAAEALRKIDPLRGKLQSQKSKSQEESPVASLAVGI